MNGNILYQQLIGVINISIPLIALYFLFPQYLMSFWAIMLCSVIVGVYLANVIYRSTRQLAAGLKFIPSDPYLKFFNKEIEHCGLHAEEVFVRYAYADDGIAVTLLNTIAIDPMQWKGNEDDPEFVKAKSVIETHILPGVSENKKTLHTAIKKIISPDAQTFIFRHELGHIFFKYSLNRVIVVGVIGFIATCVGLMSTRVAMDSLGGFKALVLGMLVGTAVDLLLSYLSNIFFKSREEKKADMFAAQMSSKQEIEAAADFFERYEQYAQEYRKSEGGLIAFMPTILLSGHIGGVGRARYLRKASFLKDLK